MVDTKLFPAMVRHLKMWSMWGPLLYNMVMIFVSWLCMTCLYLQRTLFNMHDLLTEVTVQGISNMLLEKWSVNIYHWIHIFVRLWIFQVMWRMTLNLFVFHWAGLTPGSWYWICIFGQTCGRALRNSHSEYWTHTKSLFENLSVHTCCASEK